MRQGSSRVPRKALIARIAIVVTALIGAVTVVVVEGPAGAGPAPLTVPDTEYAIPAGARFVAPSGSDSNPGTQAAPFATLAAALATAPTGATVVLRAGTYHETINSIYKRVTIQAYPHEQVWLDGRVQVTGWSVSGSAWVHSSWNPALCQTCWDPAAILPEAPAAGLPDMVFVDDEPLAQVTTLGALGAGKFFVNPSAHTLYLGSNPTGHVVKAAEFAKALQFNTSGAAGSIVRGIGVIGYASSFDSSANSAMVIVNTTNVVLENDVFAWSASRGVAALSHGTVIRHSTFSYNGFQGLVANTANGLVIDSSRFRYSNNEHFVYGSSPVSGAAGVKITSTSDVTVRDSVFDDNYASGLRFDISTQNITMVRNFVNHNLWNGIAIEISDTGLVASNMVTNNGALGLKISGATRMRVWNNTLANNGTAQLGLYEDSRSNTNATQRAAGLTWDTANVALQNNLFASDNGLSTLPLVHTFDTNSPKHVGAAQMISSMDYDAYARSAAVEPRYEHYWATLSGQYFATNYSALTSFRPATGLETSGIEYAAAPSAPLFVDESAGDFNLPTGSPSRGTGRALPADIAAAIGVTGGVAVNRGALQWPAPTTTTIPPEEPETPPLPAVGALSPRSGSTHGATVVTVTGNNFNGTTKVWFGTAAASKLTIVSPTKLLATAPASSAQTVHVTVTSFAGTSAATSADAYSFKTPTGQPAPKPLPVPSASRSGYWMLDAAGRAYAFGNANWMGDSAATSVAVATRRDGKGYWIVDAGGRVWGFGSAADRGGHPALRPGEQVSTVSPTPSGLGYWLFTTRGRVFAYGDAHFYGDMGNTTLSGPVVASSPTASGRGYYMVGSDGGVFSFGDARFHGSTGGMRLSQPVIGIAPTADGRGYWLVASDGGVFAFAAPFRGSMGGTRLTQPVNGVVAFGNGYLMVASDGGVFTFSNKHFSGSRSGNGSASPIVDIAAFST